MGLPIWPSLEANLPSELPFRRGLMDGLCEGEVDAKALALIVRLDACDEAPPIHNLFFNKMIKFSDN